jgi:hypothetical protein
MQRGHHPGDEEPGAPAQLLPPREAGHQQGHPAQRGGTAHLETVPQVGEPYVNPYLSPYAIPDRMRANLTLVCYFALAKYMRN